MPGVPEHVVQHMDAFSARVTRLTHLTSSAPELLQALRNFDRFDAASLVAGLLLAPECRPAVPRIEALVHAVVMGCAGSRRPERRDIANWFNRHVDRSELGRSEDPTEVMLAMRVWCDAGNFQFCGGIWEHADYIVQTVLDLMDKFPEEPEFQVVKQAVLALLRIANDAIERCELSPLETGADGYVVQVPLPDAETMTAHASFLRFSRADLKVLGVDPAILGAFVLPPAHYAVLAQEDFRFSTLNRFPLLERNGEFLLALPTGVCFAIREFFVQAMSRMGLAGQMGDLLRKRQLHSLGYDCLLPLDGVQIMPEGRPSWNPNLPVDDFIVRFDVGSYCIAWFARDERFRAGRAADSKRSWDEFLHRIRLYPWRLADGDAPAGFKVRDIAPWHFRRRFALLARPLVVLDNQIDPRVVVCPAQWHESFDHLTRQTALGSFHKEFFDSAGMRTVVRDFAQRRATEFEEKVDDLFKAAGFSVRMNLAMHTLGAPKQLGEIDVLAWKPSGEVWVVECKLLRAVYSMADVVHQLEEFGGNPGDELGQHLGRIEWLDANRSALTKLSNSIPAHNLRALLVTSNIVPLQFLTDNRFRGTQVVNYGAIGRVVPSLPISDED